MDDLKLAALMCSKVCHDLISPVGALSNGLEVLAEDDDPEMREHAMALLEASAAQATAKLKFARLAYGSSGSRAGEIDLRDAEVAVRDLLGGGKIDIQWDAPAMALDKDVVKVLVNLASAACDTIPRGGVLVVSVVSGETGGEVSLAATGTKARLADETRAALSGEVMADDLDVRTVVPHICGVLARAFGQGVGIVVEEGLVRFSFTFAA